MAVDAYDLALADLGLDPPRRDPRTHHVAHVSSLGPDVVELHDAAVPLAAIATTIGHRGSNDEATLRPPTPPGRGHLVAMQLAPPGEVVPETALAPPLPAVLGMPAEVLLREPAPALAAPTKLGRRSDYRQRA